MYSRLERGTCLVASPDIQADHFFRSVILLCEHTESGSFGITLNSPLNIDLPQEIAPPEQVSNPNIRIRSGGPVMQTQMMLLHSCRDIKNQTLEIIDNVYLGGDLKFLQETLKEPSGPELLLCFGYAGWGPGELEQEFMAGQWFVSPANQELIFTQNPESLWKQTLRSMGGKYALLSMIPEDLSTN
ncbi:MAG: hypothetical protein S4CHLAM102_03640 [Chlamydiia bacterium]|nr:hypothetical protein [Chlamydiia bacterium]